MRTITKKYTNDEITVVWKPHLCIHATRCFKELPEVFRPQERPWIRMEEIPTERIIQQVDRCPTDALSYFFNEEGKVLPSPENLAKIEILPNGPLVVRGHCLLVDGEGKEVSVEKAAALCRCGASRKKPYCDGTHKTIDFKG